MSIAGWAVVAPGFAAAARRYVAQVDLSLRPSTVKHIESDLRELGSWLADTYPDVSSCADLERHHIEALQVVGRRQARPLHRQALEPGQR